MDSSVKGAYHQFVEFLPQNETKRNETTKTIADSDPDTPRHTFKNKTASERANNAP